MKAALSSEIQKSTARLGRYSFRFGRLGTRSSPWLGYVVGMSGYLTIAVLGTRSVLFHHGTIGLLYDWDIPATRVALERWIHTSWQSYNPTNLGSFSIFGQGPIWSFGLLFLVYAGLTPAVLTHALILVPTVIGGTGGMLLAAFIFRDARADLRYPIVIAWLLGLVYITSGDSFFIISDGAIPLLWLVSALPYVVLLALWASVTTGPTRGVERSRWILFGLAAGVLVTISQFGWWALPVAWLLRAVVRRRPLKKLAARLSSIIGDVVLSGLATITVNLYWILHLLWVYILHPYAIVRTIGHNSGLDHVNTSPTPVEALGLTGSVPGRAAAFLANSVVPNLTLWMAFAGAVVILLLALGGRKSPAKAAVGAYILFGLLTSGTAILGPIVGRVWVLPIMTPFRGFVHFELYTAIVLIVGIAFLLRDADRRTVVVTAISATVMMAGALSLPWLSGGIGGNGGATGLPVLRTFEASRTDSALIQRFAKSNMGILNIPTSGSIFYESIDRYGQIIWRGGGLNRTVEYSGERIVAALSGYKASSPADLNWFDESPFLPDVTSAELAHALQQWDIGEVRVSRNAAAWVPSLGTGDTAVPATLAREKLVQPYFLQNGESSTAFYYRVIGSKPDWATCLTGCRGKRVVSPSPSSRIHISKGSSLIRIAMVNSGMVRLSCRGGRVRLNSGIGKEVTFSVLCPSGWVNVRFGSAHVDRIFDGVTLGLLAMWLGYVAAVGLGMRRRRRGRVEL